MEEIQSIKVKSKCDCHCNEYFPTLISFTVAPKSIKTLTDTYKATHIHIHTYIYIYIYIRGGTVHVFVPKRHGTDLSVRCMRPYDEYRQFTPNPEGCARSNITLFDNRHRQQKNSECCELHA